MIWYEKTKRAIRFWLLRRLPTCKQTVAVISQAMERSLTWRERVLLKLHLWVCMWCQWYLEHLQIMRNTLRAGTSEAAEPILVSSATFSTEARERIKSKVTSGN